MLGPPLYIGPRIRHRRTSLGLSNVEVARRMGLHDSILSLWECDKRPVPVNRLDSLALALETDPLWFLDSTLPADECLSSPVLQLGPAMPSVSQVQPAAEPEPEPELQPTPGAESGPTRLARSEVELLWCTSSHGARDRDGNPIPPRRHHHGPRPSFAVPLAEHGTWMVRVVTRTEDL